MDLFLVVVNQRKKLQQQLKAQNQQAAFLKGEVKKQQETIRTLQKTIEDLSWEGKG